MKINISDSTINKNRPADVRGLYINTLLSILKIYAKALELYLSYVCQPGANISILPSDLSS